MVAQLLGLAFLFLPTGLITFAAKVNINPAWEVVYEDSRLYGTVNKAVILECGSLLPDLFIWSFTKPGTDAIKAVVYDLGKGSRIQTLAETFGHLTLISNSASLSIESLSLAARGLFTCQAIYDIDKEPRVHYYYVHLTVRVPVSKPDLLMSDASPVEGYPMWMRCSVVNGTEPIHYVWKHETRDGRITNFAESNTSTITVNTVTRNHTGWYRCMVSNAVSSEISNRLWLDTIFGPDVPQITVTPYSITERGYSAMERETVSLLCKAQSNPASDYVWYYNSSQVFTGEVFTIKRILRMHTGDYACLAHNSYLNKRTKKTISLTVYYPPDGSPTCSMEPVLNHTSLRLFCSWPGGYPAPSLRWTGDAAPVGQSQAVGREQTDPVNNTAILLLNEGLTPSNHLFACVGSHQALTRSTECSARSYIPPAEPVCLASLTDNRQNLILSCSWTGGAPNALVWWEGHGGQENSNVLSVHYGAAQSEKPYTCHAKHPLLAQTKTCKFSLGPMPPNATLTKVVYKGPKFTEVELEWRVESEERTWTGFILEHTQVSVRPGRRGHGNDSKERMEEITGSKVWYHNIIEDPDVRSYTVTRLTPVLTYQFRITAVNHLTLGHPSAAKTPAEPGNSMYPAVIGAAIGGMLFAALLALVLFLFIFCNRNNSRLRHMLFGSQHSQSRENINIPEDEVVAASEGEITGIGELASQGPAVVLPRASSPLTISPLSATPATSQAPPPEDNNEPVNVTITVQATGS